MGKLAIAVCLVLSLIGYVFAGSASFADVKEELRTYTSKNDQREAAFKAIRIEEQTTGIRPDLPVELKTPSVPPPEQIPPLSEKKPAAKKKKTAQHHEPPQPNEIQVKGLWIGMDKSEIEEKFGYPIKKIFDCWG